MMVKMPLSLGCSKRCWRRWETLLRRNRELIRGPQKSCQAADGCGYDIVCNGMLVMELLEVKRKDLTDEMFDYTAIVFVLASLAYLDAFSHPPVSIAECKEG